ncbi:MAG: NEAT domain-containing protein [Culicoidibacterales bacterium]
MNKWLKILLVCLLMSGQLPVHVFASSEHLQVEQQLANGEYTIEQLVLKADSDEPSSAGNFLQRESQLSVADHQQTLQLVFNSGSLMSNLHVSINGEPVAFSETVTGSGMNSTLALQFSIPSLTEMIELEMTIMGTMTHKVRIFLQVETLKLVELATPELPETELPETELPETELPETELPETELPEVEVPETPNPELPETPQPDLEQSDVLYYSIEQQVFKGGTTEPSIAGNFLQKLSTITETQGQKQLTLTFDSGALISNVVVRMNGETIPTQQTQLGSGEQATLAIQLPIVNLTDHLEMDMTIMGTMHHTITIVLRPETLTLLNQAPTPPVDSTPPVESTPTPTPTPEVTPVNPEAEADLSETLSVEQLVIGQTYLIKNHVISTVATPRKAINEYSYLTKQANGYQVTFGMSMLDLMTNIRFTIANQAVTPTLTNVTATTSDFQVTYKNLSDENFVSAYVPALGRDVTFEIQLDTSAIYRLSSDQSQQSLGSANEQATQVETTPQAEPVVSSTELAVTKRYTIENEVISASELGYSMARKYLQKQAVIEEVDAQMYLSLTFTGTDMMENIHFSVNGSAVAAELTLNDQSQFMQTYRFKIGALTDEIQAHMFIIPSQMTIQFGVQLLPETLTEITDETAVNVETPTAGVSTQTTTPEITLATPVQTASIPFALIGMSVASIGGGSYALIRHRKHQQPKNETEGA